MPTHAVRLSVVAPISFECSFWTEDDGWKASCEALSLVAFGTSFEAAKASLSLLLKAQVEAVMREYMEERRPSSATVIPIRAKKKINSSS
jgi:hypothetical protein